MQFRSPWILMVAILFLSSLPVQAQEGLLDKSKQVEEVIQLRSPEVPQPPAPPTQDALPQVGPPRGAGPAAIASEEITPLGPAARPISAESNSAESDEGSERVADQRNSQVVAPPRIGAPSTSGVDLSGGNWQLKPQLPVESVSIPTTSETTPALLGAWQTQPSVGVTVPMASPVSVTTAMPQLTTRVIAPRQINLKQVVPFRIQMRNPGVADARGLKVIATLPTHVEFVAAQPQPTRVNGREYEFAVDEISRNGNREIQIDLIPNEKKPIRLETELWIANRQDVEVAVREPQLGISIEGPGKSYTGQRMVHTIIVENRGDGIAESLQLNCHLPESIGLVEGQSEYFLDQLAPGQSSRLQIASAAYQPGEVEMAFEVKSLRTAATRTASRIEVYQPELSVSATGPRINFVERDGIYTIQVANTGQVDLTEVELAIAVPEGMRVTTVSRQAGIDPATGILVWEFDELPAGAEESVQLKAICSAAGRQVCRIAASSRETRAEKFDLVTEVQTRADVSLQVTNQGGPIEIGHPTAFVIRIENRGSSVARGVRLIAELPRSLLPAIGQGYEVDEAANSVMYAPLDLGAGEVRELRFEAMGAQVGEHVVRGVLTIADSPRQLIAEDSIYVFETEHSKISESLQPAIRR